MASKNGGKSVMGNLPSTRPERIGGRREGRNGDGDKHRASAPKGTTTPRKPPASSKPKAVTSKPRAVRSGSPGLKAAQEKSVPPRSRPSAPPKGTELVTTAVQAAGELAQIGFTLGGQMVKRVAKRLPKP